MFQVQASSFEIIPTESARMFNRIWELSNSVTVENIDLVKRCPPCIYQLIVSYREQAMQVLETGRFFSAFARGGRSGRSTPQD